MTAVRTACPYCGVGCGILATPSGDRSVTIKGDTDHPANAGRLCSKGTHLGETVGLEGRLLHPEIGNRRASWDEALDLVAAKFKSAITDHGPDSVAFYVSGQLLTEDYYVANKLMKGFIGSANIDTNSRLCMASAVAAHVRAFGEDVVPCSYSDLEEADLILLVGSNTAWCHPVVWQRIEAAREKRGTRLVVIDPRRTETAERADLHLAIAPDSDVALFNGLLREMRERWRLDGGYMAQHVDTPPGFWQAIEAIDVASACDIPPSDLETFYTLFADRPRTVTLFSQGVNQSIQGTDKANAIINLHLATGRVGKPGAGPFSITGQPNAMGGREVGGLASMLAAHMGFSEAERDRARRFWKSPVICPGPGLKAVELFEAAAKGKIKALWIMATNPAVSMPDARMTRVGLANCPFVVVSDVIAGTDTGRYAQVRLPALAWGEKDGTVTNSERCISRQRRFFGAPGETRADWRIICDVAARMGWADHFDYADAAGIFREFAAQTAFENNGSRVLDLGGLAGLSGTSYDNLEPYQWGGVSPFATGEFATTDGRARLVPVSYAPRPSAPRAHALVLNTGRYRDHWHTMTRTGLSPRLSQHRREPLVEVHPETMARMKLSDGGLAVVETPHGKSVFRVAAHSGQRRRELFVPIHWTDATSGGGRAGLLTGPDRDPVSGQPGFKNTPATIAPFRPDWTGILVTSSRPHPPACAYWTQVRTGGGWVTELAGTGDAAPLASALPEGDRIEMADVRRGTIRAAVLADGALVGALFVVCDASLPPREWIAAQLGLASASSAELLAGRPAAPLPDRGQIICVCFDIGLKTIVNAVATRALTSVEAVGQVLSAGTNCGSCRPAIAKLLENPKVAANA